MHPKTLNAPSTVHGSAHEPESNNIVIKLLYIYIYIYTPKTQLV